jgi:hypothetical protein
MERFENSPLLIVWKALATLAIIVVTAWYGTTFVDHPRVASHFTAHN